MHTGAIGSLEAGWSARSKRILAWIEEYSVDYPIAIEPDDNEALLVTCPDLPEVTTFGEDEEDALQRAGDAI